MQETEIQVFPVEMDLNRALYVCQSISKAKGMAVRSIIMTIRHDCHDSGKKKLLLSLLATLVKLVTGLGDIGSVCCNYKL